MSETRETVCQTYVCRFDPNSDEEHGQQCAKCGRPSFQHKFVPWELARWSMDYD